MRAFYIAVLCVCSAVVVACGGTTTTSPSAAALPTCAPGASQMALYYPANGSTFLGGLPKQVQIASAASLPITDGIMLSPTVYPQLPQVQASTLQQVIPGQLLGGGTGSLTFANAKYYQATIAGSLVYSTTYDVYVYDEVNLTCGFTGPIGSFTTLTTPTPSPTPTPNSGI